MCLVLAGPSPQGHANELRACMPATDTHFPLLCLIKLYISVQLQFPALDSIGIPFVPESRAAVLQMHRPRIALSPMRRAAVHDAEACTITSTMIDFDAKRTCSATNDTSAVSSALKLQRKLLSKQEEIALQKCYLRAAACFQADFFLGTQHELVMDSKSY